MYLETHDVGGADFFVLLCCLLRCLVQFRSYLELADWHLADAMRSAREDNEWEQEMDGGTEALRSGQIRITLNGGRLQAAGAGMVQPATGATAATTNTSHLEAPDSPSAGSTRSAVVTPPREWKRVTNPEALPDIATKTVKAQDVYQVRVARGGEFAYIERRATLPLVVHTPTHAPSHISIF